MLFMCKYIYIDDFISRFHNGFSIIFIDRDKAIIHSQALIAFLSILRMSAAMLLDLLG